MGYTTTSGSYTLFRDDETPIAPATIPPISGANKADRSQGLSCARCISSGLQRFAAECGEACFAAYQGARPAAMGMARRVSEVINMTSGSVLSLALSIALFSISHIALLPPPLRSRLVTWLGETPSRALLRPRLRASFLGGARLSGCASDRGQVSADRPKASLAAYYVDRQDPSGGRPDNPRSVGNRRRAARHRRYRSRRHHEDHAAPGDVGRSSVGTAHLPQTAMLPALFYSAGSPCLHSSARRRRMPGGGLQFGAEWQRFTERTSYLPARGARKAHPADVWRDRLVAHRSRIRRVRRSALAAPHGCLRSTHCRCSSLR